DPLQGPGQLQAIERIPARGVEQPTDGEPGQPGTGHGPHGRLEGAQGQWADPQPRKAITRQARPGRHRGPPVPPIPDRREESGPPTGDPPESEPPHAPARDIPPTEVRDGQPPPPPPRTTGGSRQGRRHRPPFAQAGCLPGPPAAARPQAPAAAAVATGEAPGRGPRAAGRRAPRTTA